MSKKIIYILMAALFLSSCSIFNWSRTPVHVIASESDAKIYVNGEYMGNGNIQTTVPRRTNVSVMVKKDGFAPTQRELTYRLGTVGLIDLVFGFVWLVPFLGLAFPGAYVVDPENVSVILEKQ
ncbi:MAG: PEGA domain-containing protein [Alphaproteobacteria bacterium]